MSSYICDVCGEKTKHNEQYDAFYCEKCDRWQEPPCCTEKPIDKYDCLFHCWERPAKPSEVK